MTEEEKNIAATQTDTQTDIDWGEVHRRVKEAGERLKTGWSLSEEEKKKIFKDRARELARELEKEDKAIEYLEVIEFYLDDSSYGIEPGYIRDVFPLRELAPIPCAPNFILGIINVHGQIQSVVDIKRFFELSDKGLADHIRVILLQNDEMEFCILVDEVVGARLVPVNDIKPPFLWSNKISGYMKGVTHDNLIILDAEKILSERSLIVHEEV